MGAAAGQLGRFPALAVVLALFMLGYVVWTTDRLTSPIQARTSASGPGRNQDRQPPAGVLTAAPSHQTDAPSPPAAAGTRHEDRAGRPVLAPRLAACGKIVMSLTMGYMLVLML
jgi:hypothetical protein